MLLDLIFIMVVVGVDVKSVGSSRSKLEPPVGVLYALLVSSLVACRATVLYSSQ